MVKRDDIRTFSFDVRVIQDFMKYCKDDHLNASSIVNELVKDYMKDKKQKLNDSNNWD
ncbi:hypothetical protein ACIQAA_27175 [Neobacillus sp. NPDC093182]|uniref:hypothetical protein n=1 Tax=Neobacillus sp. NPDC093182 TaxID=3364297 RepID=UPI0037FF3249